MVEHLSSTTGRGAHGSGISDYGSELLVPVLEIVKPELNREGVPRFRFQNCQIQFGPEPKVFR